VRLIEALRAAVPIAETYSRLVLRERHFPLGAGPGPARREREA